MESRLHAFESVTHALLYFPSRSGAMTMFVPYVVSNHQSPTQALASGKPAGPRATQNGPVRFLEPYGGTRH